MNTSPPKNKIIHEAIGIPTVSGPYTRRQPLSHETLSLLVGAAFMAYTIGITVVYFLSRYGIQSKCIQ